MAPDQYDADINIERFRIWKIKIADQSFGMDILGTEQEILSLFHNMCHVIIRAIAAVTDIDIFYSIQNIVPVNNITESTEFIFAADRLDQRIRVSMGIQVIKSVQVHAVDNQIADGKSVLGLMSIDYKKPVKVISEDEKFMKQIEKWAVEE